MLAKHLPSVMSKKAMEAQMKAERLEMAKAGCRALSQIRSEAKAEAKAKAAAKAAPKAWTTIGKLRPINIDDILRPIFPRQPLPK